MIKVKIDLPQFDRRSVSPENNGVNGKNAGKLKSLPRGNEHKLKKDQQHFNNSNKHIKSPNLKANIRANLNSKHSQQLLGNSINKSFKGNTNIGLNANNQGFALGLKQNLSIAVQLLFNTSNPIDQKALQKFTGQEVLSSLFLNAGIFSEVNVNTSLHNKSSNPILDNPVFNQILIFISQNNPSNNPIQQIQNLWQNTGGIFSDTGCCNTVEDLEIIIKVYANALEKGDIDTIVKLTELLEKGQKQTDKGNEKLDKLLTQLISKGEKVAVKDAQTSNLNFQKNLLSVAPRTEPQVQQKIETTKNPNQFVAVKDQIFVSEKTKFDKSDFYTEKTETGLRKQLDYYPHFAYDRQISAFENPEEVNLGKQEFVDKHYSEIENWINSGKHRLVKDFEFEKPLGMIVDREESGFITADKIRVVLVRDGSVDGWHFLRSFLII